MSLEDIAGLSDGIRGMVADDAHLYLWVTNSFMEQGHQVARAWGFMPKTIITWVKVRLGTSKPSMGTGTWYRSATEHLLFCVRGSLRLLRPDKPMSTAMLLPRLEHSRKPEEFHRMIEEQSPGPRLELFARREVPGWDRWGNEVISTVSLGNIVAGAEPINVKLNHAKPASRVRFGGVRR